MAKQIIVLIFMFFVSTTSSADTADFKCTADFCLNYEVVYKCSSLDLDVCYNDTQAYLHSSPTECGCCDTCLKFQSLGDACIIGAPGQSLPTEMCGPNLKCQNYKCVPMEENVEDPLKVTGDYECVDDMCDCISKTDTGNPKIFGRFNISTIKKDSLQCQCSSLAHKIQSFQTRAFPFDVYQPFARCLPTGQFDPLQCQDGFCSCVDPATGVLDETVPMVSIWSLGKDTILCYDPDQYGHTKEYYRECEKASMVLQKAKDLAEAEGYTFLFPFKINCLPDGNFDGDVSSQVRQGILAMESAMSLQNYFIG